MTKLTYLIFACGLALPGYGAELLFNCQGATDSVSVTRASQTTEIKVVGRTASSTLDQLGLGDSRKENELSFEVPSSLCQFPYAGSFDCELSSPGSSGTLTYHSEGNEVSTPIEKLTVFSVPDVTFTRVMLDVELPDGASIPQLAMYCRRE